jgi:predicted alpha-1,2-mannosidase
LWDTYRAAHPLSTLIHPDKQQDFAKTFLKICEQQGRLPVWHLMANETDCMVGNPALPVLSDIVLKGFDVDGKAALEAMKQTAMVDSRSIGLIKKYGFIPWDKEPTNETVAKAMEYALADDALARVAKQLGDDETYEYFYKRGQSYKKYFDPKTGFVRAVDINGKFREPFDPIKVIHRADDYTEGNAWQYTWLVPHDVKGLVGLFGSEEAFVTKLDSLFVVEGDLGEEASPDISGLIGQYAHGNEPSHHTIYLYNYVGQPWKTAQRLREVMTTLYKADPDGLCGNEDVGQMSAWYILSSLGLYQVEPAGGRYVFGSPLFNSADVKMGDKILHIVAHNNSAENIYIQSVRWNGQPYDKSYIDFKDLKQGGTLEFEMGAYPSDAFGVAPESRP